MWGLCCNSIWLHDQLHLVTWPTTSAGSSSSSKKSSHLGYPSSRRGRLKPIGPRNRIGRGFKSLVMSKTGIMYTGDGIIWLSGSILVCCCCCSVSKSCLTLRHHGLQHSRLPCPSLAPGVCSNSCPLSWWCYLTISSSAAPFSFCLPSFPASESFLMSWLFASSGQSIGTSASASVLSMNFQGWLPLGLTGLISLKFKGLPKAFSSTTVWKHQLFGFSLLFWSSSHIHTLIMWAIVGKVMSLLFTTLPGFVISSLPRSKCLLISWLQSLSAVILEPKKRKSVIVSTFSPSICHEVMGPDAWSSFFECWVLSFFHSLLPSSRGFLVSLHFLSLEWYQLHIWGCWYFSHQSWFQPIIYPAWHFTWCTLHIS